MSLSTLLERPDRVALQRDAARIVLANTPANEDEVGQVIFRLLIMYPEFDRRSEASKAMVVDQWRSSLTGWPVDILEKASQRWINGEKASFLPQPGNIVDACQQIGAYRKALAKKAADFLDLTKDDQ